MDSRGCGHELCETVLPPFLGESREASFLEFKHQMGGRVDPETELMYRHFTELGGPTPWSQVGGGYGTFYIYDMYAAILALEGGGSYEPAVLRHRIPSGNHMHDRGKVDAHRTQRFSEVLSHGTHDGAHSPAPQTSSSPHEMFFF